MAAVAALLACHLSTLGGMAAQWWNDEDMGHGFLVPVVIGWIIWNERRRWRSVPAQPSWWGIPLLIAGAALHYGGGAGRRVVCRFAGLPDFGGRRDCLSRGLRPAARVGLSALSQSLHAPQAGLCLQHGDAAVAVAGQPHGGGDIVRGRNRRNPRGKYSGCGRASRRGGGGVQWNPLSVAARVHGVGAGLCPGSEGLDESRAAGGGRAAGDRRQRACAWPLRPPFRRSIRELPTPLRER